MWGSGCPGRDARCWLVDAGGGHCQRRGRPVGAVETTKTEVVGKYRNSGREWEPKGRPREVKAKDFPDKELGKVIPYGVYDPTDNVGWVGVGAARRVFQLTETRRDGCSGGVESHYALWVAYLMGQSGYALLRSGLGQVRRAYWAWVDRLEASPMCLICSPF